MRQRLNSLAGLPLPTGLPGLKQRGLRDTRAYQGIFKNKNPDLTIPLHSWHELIPLEIWSITWTFIVTVEIQPYVITLLLHVAMMWHHLESSFKWGDWAPTRGTLFTSVNSVQGGFFGGGHATGLGSHLKSQLFLECQPVDKKITFHQKIQIGHHTVNVALVFLFLTN